jgi:P4 family phage/plasmid primase-like protien
MTVYEQAERLVAAGISVVPILADGSKRPAVGWKCYQSRLPTPLELKQWFDYDLGWGLAIIGGTISGNAEILDFDDPAVFDRWWALIEWQEPAMADTLAIIDTPGPGVQVIYRCPVMVPGNQKLAQRPSENGREVLIETRGEGGYAITVPSPPECHPNRQPYRMRQGDLSALPRLDFEDWCLLIEAAKSFNRCVELPRKPARQGGIGNQEGDRPGDAYNARGDWGELLQKHGWRCIFGRGEVEHWQRPGKDGTRDKGASATLGYVAPGIFYVFSTNCHPFEAEKTYDLFGAFTLLDHSGDFQAAGRALRRLGYGEPAKRLDAAESSPGAVSGASSEASEPEERPNNTDKGNGIRLARRHGADLRYSATYEWLVWNGKKWERDETQEVIRRAKETVSSIYAEAAAIADTERRAAQAKWALASESVARIMAMVKLAESEPGIQVRADAIDLNPWLLNVANGTLDLQTGEFYDHRREDMIMRLIPTPYDPAATCPRWEQFLCQVMAGRDDLVAYLQRWAGYCLTGDVSEQQLLFLHGMGANGKSTFLKVLLTLLGEYAQQAAVGLLLERKYQEHTTEIAELAGKRLVVSTEVGEGKRMAEELVKQMTGGDRMRGRFMRCDNIEFEPTFKLLLAANHKPVIRGTDYAIWRRIPLVPFDVTFSDTAEPRKDPTLLPALLAELPGILAWAVRGCLAWQQERLKQPEAVVAASAEYRAEMDVLGPFIEANCTKGDPAVTQARAGDLHSLYKMWAEETGERAMSSTAFGRALVERGFIPHKDGYGKRWWKGIAIREQHNQGDQELVL